MGGGGVERTASFSPPPPPFPPRTDSGVATAALERGCGAGGVSSDAIVVVRGERIWLASFFFLKGKKSGKSRAEIEKKKNSGIKNSDSRLAGSLSPSLSQAALDSLSFASRDHELRPLARSRRNDCEAGSAEARRQQRLCCRSCSVNSLQQAVPQPPPWRLCCRRRGMGEFVRRYVYERALALG